MKEAKYKADELIEKFVEHTTVFNVVSGNWQEDLNSAKKCALICVDEQIELLEIIEADFTDDIHTDGSHKYITLKLYDLYKVKQEILNRQ